MRAKCKKCGSAVEDAPEVERGVDAPTFAEKSETKKYWDDIDKQVELLNKLIRAAGDHGSDGQGWYYTNKEDLELAIKEYLYHTGLCYVTELYWNSGGDMPLIAVRSCRCDGCLSNYLKSRKGSTMNKDILKQAQGEKEQKC